MGILNRMSEWHNSTWELAVSLVAIIAPPLGVAFYCAYQVSIGNGHEQFRLAFVDVPKYLGAGASYLDVLILDAIAVLALLVGLGFRYYYFRHERDFIKKYNIETETGIKSLFKRPSRSKASSNDDGESGGFGGED